jgi:hypothetical protein
MSALKSLSRPTSPDLLQPRPPSPSWLTEPLSGPPLVDFATQLGISLETEGQKISEDGLRERCFEYLSLNIAGKSTYNLRGLEASASRIHHKGLTLLMGSIRYLTVHVIEEILDMGICIGVKGPDGQTPLHTFAAIEEVLNEEWGSADKIIKLLTSKGKFSVNALDARYAAPIHVAAAAGNHGVLKALIESGANITGLANWPLDGRIQKLSPLKIAQANLRDECKDLLVEAMIKLGNKAIESCKLEEAEAIFNEFELHNLIGEDYNEVLSALTRIAALKGDEKKVKELKKKIATSVSSLYYP